MVLLGKALLILAEPEEIGGARERVRVLLRQAIVGI